MLDSGEILYHVIKYTLVFLVRMIRKRSSSEASFGGQLSDNEEIYWSVSSSSNRVPAEPSQTLLYPVKSIGRMEEIQVAPVQEIRSVVEISNVSLTQTPYPHRRLQGSSSTQGMNLNRRGSSSLPEQLSAIQLSGRLSQVGDELEASRKMTISCQLTMIVRQPNSVTSKQ
ncbi:unnamed protein product [Dicrocoelium dendriticum]|nr:unnamed protein product [Dicrocoelium dendriticum]